MCECVELTWEFEIGNRSLEIGLVNQGEVVSRVSNKGELNVNNFEILDELSRLNLLQAHSQTPLLHLGKLQATCSFLVPVQHHLALLL